jgi:hypothetical protein
MGSIFLFPASEKLCSVLLYIISHESQKQWNKQTEFKGKGKFMDAENHKLAATTQVDVPCIYYSRTIRHGGRRARGEVMETPADVKVQLKYMGGQWWGNDGRKKGCETPFMQLRYDLGGVPTLSQRAAPECS